MYGKVNLALRLNRIPRIDPRFQPAEQRFDLCVSVVQHEERRTGARMFVRSGTVRDDPLVFAEIHAIDVNFKFIQWNGQRADYMLLAVRFRASHIHDDRRAGSVGCVCFFQRNARNIRFGERQV